MYNDINGSEAVFGFVAWLTCRDKPITLSSHDEAGQAAELANVFCRVNNLEPVRDDKYPENLTHPSN